MALIIIPIDILKIFIREAFLKAGVSESDSQIAADVLLSADLRGIESHGIARLKMYLDRIRDGIISPTANFEIVRESPGCAVVDGHHSLGLVIAQKAMKIAIEKAKKTGISAVAVRNSSHFGIAGYYAQMAVKENMAGIAVTNARPAVAPTFGRELMFGTNPIAFGAPTDEECPFLLDMSTSLTQRGKIEVYERENRQIPVSWAIDYLGNPVTDPGKLLEDILRGTASLLPLGGAGEELSGHKGYGLGIMVEILSSAFSGGAYGKDLSGIDEEGNKTPHKIGHFFSAICVSHFVDIDEFKKITGGILRSLRSSKKLPGKERIYTAGEKEFEKEKQIATTGVLVNEKLQEILHKIKTEYAIKAELPI